MRFALTTAALCLAANGCASLLDTDCRSDWYYIGVRDGRAGVQPHADTYVAHCRPNGVEPDTRRYMEGWEAGFRALRAA
jgi:hypothetical protein